MITNNIKDAVVRLMLDVTFQPDKSLIVAYDPGMNTGMAVCQTDETTFEVSGACVVPWECRFTISSAFMYFRPAVIVVESFHLYKNKAMVQAGSPMWSSQIIGIIEAYANEQYILNCLHYQPASQITKVNVDKWRKTYRSPHMLDAIAHAKLYWIKNIRKEVS
jgi:hypothetical protein